MMWRGWSIRPSVDSLMLHTLNHSLLTIPRLLLNAQLHTLTLTVTLLHSYDGYALIANPPRCGRTHGHLVWASLAFRHSHSYTESPDMWSNTLSPSMDKQGQLSVPNCCPRSLRPLWFILNVSLFTRRPISVFRLSSSTGIGKLEAKIPTLPFDIYRTG